MKRKASIVVPRGESAEPMPTAEFRFIQDRILRFTRPEMCDLIDRGPNAVSGFRHGAPIPKIVVRYLRLLVHSVHRRRYNHETRKGPD